MLCGAVYCWARSELKSHRFMLPALSRLIAIPSFGGDSVDRSGAVVGSRRIA